MSTTNDQMIAGYDYKEWVRLESLFLKDYENQPDTTSRLAH